MLAFSTLETINDLKLAVLSVESPEKVVLFIGDWLVETKVKLIASFYQTTWVIQLEAIYGHLM